MQRARSSKRLAGAVRTLAAGRVAQTGAWANDGPFRDAAAWMADVAGVTVGRARATIETAERLSELPKVDAALRSGTLSEVQVDVITAAAAANPRAQAALLHSAEVDGVKGLKQACARVEAAASTDQAERYEKARKDRYLRHRRISDVEGSIELRGPIDETARVYAALTPIEAGSLQGGARLRTGRSGSRPRRGRSTRWSGWPTTRRRLRQSRVGDGRRRRSWCGSITMRSPGATPRTGEVCEIVGIGPVPVRWPKKLSSDAFFKALITDGTDIRSISHLSRTIPARLRTAVEELYPECVIAGCHVDRHLQIDHNVPVEEQGPTEIGNLNPLCHHHHDLKSLLHLRLDGEGLQKRLVAGPRTPPGSWPP